MERSPEAIRSITHDMRNLLTAVRGHAELALRGLSPEDPAREDVAHVVVVTAAVFDLVDQLDGSHASTQQVAVNLDTSVASMRRLLDALLPPSIEMHLSTHAEGGFVPISKLRIERIVLNLVLNARDAMEDGGMLTITTQWASDQEVRIIVTDTGPGFAPEALEHLFQEGFTTKRDHGGSGNGLASLKRFVDRVGGSIAVESVPGEGASVIVTLRNVELEERTFGTPARAVAAAVAEAGESGAGADGAVHAEGGE